MILIVGLGNPGKEYEKTRHNAGFLCVDWLAKKLSAEPFRLEKKFRAETAEAVLDAEKILLAKPQTFMNLSGQAVQAMVHYHRCPPENLWLIYDDVDLPLGKIRIRHSGSGGTHNGMKSVIASLGYADFPRIRIGVESRGRSAPEQQDIASFVLQNIPASESPIFRKSLQNAADGLLDCLKEGIEKGMEKYN